MKLKIAYQINSLETVYAARFIYEGYKDAFIEKEHEFRPYTSSDNIEQFLDEFQPDIFISSLNSYNLKFLDLKVLKKHRERGMLFLNQIRPWKKQSEQYGGSDLEHEHDLVRLIKNGLAGDVFFHWLEQDDPHMDGFERETGYGFETIILAANTKLFYPEYDEKYKADISYVGSFLSSKKTFMSEHFFPLMHKYNMKTYGSDWTLQSRLLGYIQKAGQYFNIQQLKGIRNMPLSFEDEHKVYTSSLISLNIHEDHQRKFGSDFNERTLKIMASGGFEICDDVAVLRKYFTPEELVIAENKEDWFEKIDYYIRNPDERLPIIEAGRKKVLEEHTYLNRVDQIISIYNRYNGKQDN